MDYGNNEITNVKEVTWEDTNYPYNKPDKQICLIEICGMEERFLSTLIR